MFALLGVMLVGFMVDIEGDVRAIPAAEPEEAYIEIDFTPMPCEKGPWKLTVTVESTLKELTYSEVVNSDGIPREVLCETIASGLKDVRFKAQVVEKSKLRVYGATFQGKFYPATKGKVESPDLKKDELPTIKVVGKQG
jgi:hypothetical protein